MRLTKPYCRIIRPFDDGGDDLGFWYPWSYSYDYVLERRYAEDRQELSRAYKLIEKDLLRLFEYVEPTDDNLKTYSHRTYELLLRAATEFETNCKRILESNEYEKNGNLTIKDYFKINESSKLEEYRVSLTAWYPEKKELSPFREWAGGCHSLSWYRSYNNVKHDRNRNFREASLENVLCAIGGLRVVLFSQFFAFLGPPEQEPAESDDGKTFRMSGDIFEVTPPTTWTHDEVYDFEWENIIDEPKPFARFDFR